MASRQTRDSRFKSMLLILITAVTPLAIAPACAQSAQRELPAMRSQPPSVLQLLADRGNATAQLLLGGLYSRGEGVEQDDELAVSWWRKAAEQGLADAQNELGAAYADGRGVRANPQQAVEWYTRAAEQGQSVAQANLGTMYWDGTGVAKSEKRAVEWFRKAAEHGLAWAQLFLGDAYMVGRGLPMDEKLAALWYRKAAEQDYPDAQYELGRLYRTNRTVARGDNARESYGEYWLTRAVQHGDEKAEQDLKSMLQQLRKIVLSPAIAVREQPDTAAAVIRNGRSGETAYVLPDPDGVNHLKDWLAVYLEDGGTMGFISEAALRRK